MPKKEFKDPYPKPRLVLSDAVLDQMVQRSLMPTKDPQATYIGALADVDAEQAGMAVYDMYSKRTFKGTLKDRANPNRQDADERFSIQSMSKLFNAAYLGGNTIDKYEDLNAATGVGVSSELFNKAVMDAAKPHKPANAFENIGALAVAAAMTQRYPGENVAQRLCNWLEDLTGPNNPVIQINQATADSEFEDALNNQKLLKVLEESGAIPPGVDRTEVLRNYCEQCSIEMSCAQLSKAAAIFVNGKHPQTGQEILSQSTVERCRAMMVAAGGYNEAGDLFWKLDEAKLKSGVGGGLVGVTKDNVPFATFSPRLNPRGNTAESIKMLKELTAWNLKSPKSYEGVAGKLKEIKHKPAKLIDDPDNPKVNTRQASAQLFRDMSARDQGRLLQIINLDQQPGGLYDKQKNFYMKELAPTKKGRGIPTGGEVLLTTPDPRDGAAPGAIVAYVRVPSTHEATKIVVLDGADAVAARALEAQHALDLTQRRQAAAVDYQLKITQERIAEQTQTLEAFTQDANARQYIVNNGGGIIAAARAFANGKFNNAATLPVNMETVFDAVPPGVPMPNPRPEEWEAIGQDPATNLVILAKTGGYAGGPPLNKAAIDICVVHPSHLAKDNAVLDIEMNKKYKLEFQAGGRVKMAPVNPNLAQPVGQLRNGQSGNVGEDLATRRGGRK